MKGLHDVRCSTCVLQGDAEGSSFQGGDVNLNNAHHIIFFLYLQLHQFLSAHALNHMTSLKYLCPTLNQAPPTIPTIALPL